VTFAFRHQVYNYSYLLTYLLTCTSAAIQTLLLLAEQKFHGSILPKLDIINLLKELLCVKHKLIPLSLLCSTGRKLVLYY